MSLIVLRPLRNRFFLSAVACIFLLPAVLTAQPGTSPVLSVADGVLRFSTPSLRLQLLRSSQTVLRLSPQADTAFDFTPGERLAKRNTNGYYQLGDLTLRLRQGAGDWRTYSTAQRRQPVQALAATGNCLAAADLSATLPADLPLAIRRSWHEERGQLVLRFALTNRSATPVEMGALGLPMIFNNILEGKNLVQAHAQNVLSDPYIGNDAGYLQVNRLHGRGASLLVLPDGKTPFEAYRPLNDDPTPRNITFEGFHEWMICSAAYASSEWKAATPWNTPTSLVLQPGETRTIGVRLVLAAGGPATLQETLLVQQRPVAVGVPGYVLPQDVQGQLFLHYSRGIRSITAEPAGALRVQEGHHLANGWRSYQVQGIRWGRACLRITYADGLVQTVHYKVTQPEAAIATAYGRFLASRQWFEPGQDLFGRSPSMISYDYEAQRQITEEKRAWIAGLSDEAGAGSWLGAMMKQSLSPDQQEIGQLERFVDSTLWGGLQVADGPNRFGVRKSLFYYEPDSLPKGTYTVPVDLKNWSFWRKKEAWSLGRSYNYPHVTAAHWVLYRLARYHRQLVIHHDWNWYLTHAYETAMAMVRLAPDYAEFGQMEGTVFYLLLKDLQREGLQQAATALEAAMRKRAQHWASLPYPFGSEMPWDSTGQEEVYIWSLFFGYNDKAAVTLDAILAYMPTVPHWAYNGNARRYWDFLFAGKTTRIERMIHHYGSPLNAIPLLMEYRRQPANFHLLQAGYGGMMGAIANITEDGFAPCAFHSYPETLQNDGYSGDYGSGFFGYAVNNGTYLVQHPDFGWIGFGGNVARRGSWVEITPTTAGRTEIYIAQAGVWITLRAGKLQQVLYRPSDGRVRLVLDAADSFTTEACFTIEQPGGSRGIYRPVDKAVQPQQQPGDYRVALTGKPTEILLTRL